MSGKLDVGLNRNSSICHIRDAETRKCVSIVAVARIFLGGINGVDCDIWEKIGWVGRLCMVSLCLDTEPQVEAEATFPRLHVSDFDPTFDTDSPSS